MTEKDLNCPDREEIKKCLLGEVSSEKAGVLFNHFSSCAECQEKLSEIDSYSDSVTIDLEASFRAEPFDSESQCQDAVNKASKILSQSSYEKEHPSSSDEQSPSALNQTSLLRTSVGWAIAVAVLGVATLLFVLFLNRGKTELASEGNNEETELVLDPLKPTPTSEQIHSLSDEEFENLLKELKSWQQVECISIRLKQHNPEFDGLLIPEFRDGEVYGLQFSTDAVSDLSPLAALEHLKSISAKGYGELEPDFSVLSPLIGKKKKKGKLKDLSVLKQLSIDRLSIENNPIDDLTSVTDLPLRSLNIRRTNIKSIEPISRGEIADTLVSIELDPRLLQKPESQDVLKQLTKLRTVNGEHFQ